MPKRPPKEYPFGVPQPPMPLSDRLYLLALTVAGVAALIILSDKALLGIGL